MDILSLIGWRTTDLESAGRAETRPSRLPTLKIGDRLQGRVANLLHERLAVVELFGGRLRALAELRTPLEPGQHLQLQVTATVPRLTLQTMATATAGGDISAREAPPTTLIELLDSSQAHRLIGELETLTAGLKAASGTDGSQATMLMAALERLSDHLTPLDPHGEPEAIAARLLACVRDSGLFFEQKLVAAAQTEALQEAPLPAKLPMSSEMDEHQFKPQAAPLFSDLKPHLQRLLVQLPALMETLDPRQQLSHEGNRLLWTTVTTLLKEIDMGQKKLTDQRPDEASAVMRHNMWIEGRDKPLRFHVYLPRKGGGRKGTPAATPMVSLLLDLERFGTLRVDIREQPGHAPKQLKVAIWTQREAVREDLMAVSAPLTTILEQLYPEVDLKIALAPDRVAAFEKTGQPPRSGQGDQTGLDIRV
jgi:hypothetical protein